MDNRKDSISEAEKSPFRGIRRRWRTLTRKGVTWLPTAVRHRLYRRMVRLNWAPSPQLEVRLAQTREELEAAFRILHDAYVSEGYMAPHPSGLRVTLYHALPSTSTIVALWQGKVVGTLSIIRNNPLRLPLDVIFDTQPLKKRGGQIAEISALAIDRQFRGNHGEILFPMIKFLYEYCISYFGVEYMLIAVNPKQADFYEGILFFRRIAQKVVKYEFVNGAPAIGMFLDLREAYARFAAAYGALPAERNVFSYFVANPMPCLVFPDRRYFKISDPVMTPDLLHYFFNIKVALFEHLSEPERRLLVRLYDNQKYQRVLPQGKPATAQTWRDSKRFDVQCKGRIQVSAGDRTVRMTVRNVSRNGICARLDSPVRFGSRLRINVAVSDFDIADLTAVAVWSDQEGVFGFSVTESCPNWKAFLDHLARDFDREAA
jgi:hypothetical protein